MRDRHGFSSFLLSVGAGVLGFVLFVLLLFHIALAAVINTVKATLRFQRLTDFRHQEVQTLDVHTQQCNKLETPITLGNLPNRHKHALTYSIPAFNKGQPVEILLRFRAVPLADKAQNKAPAIELEYLLFDAVQKEGETVFIFYSPFKKQPEVKTDDVLIWHPVPDQRTLSLELVDIQSEQSPSMLPHIEVAILAWR